MIWGRATVAELEFDQPFGVYAGPGPFRAQALRGSAKIGGLSRGVFLLNDAWPDSDLPAQYLYSVARAGWLADDADPSSWTESALLYPADGALTPEQVRRRVAKGAIEAFGEFELVGNAERARETQQRIDRAQAELREKTPWLVDSSYDGDYAGALWAYDASGRFEPFPVSVALRPHPPYLPLLAPLKRPQGWQIASLYLTSPFTEERPAPALDAAPVTLEVFAVLPGEDERIVGELAERGERDPIATLSIGPKRRENLEQDG
ncbi:hypothetical protein [Parafrigoribacterium soli]|uniref:hypothetical protein n=1 Tax=Parafrigoribacterium soli TaxID=3144663 RepID=UPI0032EE42F9